MTKSSLKMEEAQIVDVRKITTTKVEDFNEAILVVQVCVGKFRAKHVLLDDRSSVNIISRV
jgi:hypothetical protein